MRIRKNLLQKCVICIQNQNPWDVLSSSKLSENLQIIEANNGFFRDGAPRNSPWERKRISTEAAPSTENVVKHRRPRVPRRKRHEAGANCDDIYDYYEGFCPNWKKKRGAIIQSCREAANGSNVGGKEDHDDDDEKPLKERSMKSILASA